MECYQCGDEVTKGRSPRTNRMILFNLDGTEHWTCCTEEKRAAQRKRRSDAWKLNRGLNQRMEDLIYKE